MSTSKARYIIIINGQENYTLKSGLGIRQKQPLTFSDCKELINLMIVNDHQQEIAIIQLWDIITESIKHAWELNVNNVYEKVR